MTNAAQHLLEQALELSSEDRSQLADSLLASIETARDRVEQAWKDEIHRRAAAIDSGESRLVPWDRAEAMIFGDEDAFLEA